MAKTINQKEIQAKIKEVFGKDSNLVLKALKVANKKHKGELRDDGTPYVEHPIRVAEYSYEFKKSKNASMIYMASLLHDTIEDTYTSYRELDDMFGKEVASLVMELSTAKFAPACLEGGKAEYLSKKMANMTNYALFIKFCDRYDNLCTLDGCSAKKREKTIYETKIILDYLLKNRELTGSQKNIVSKIIDKLNELDEEKTTNKE